MTAPAGGDHWMMALRRTYGGVGRPEYSVEPLESGFAVLDSSRSLVEFYTPRSPEACDAAHLAAVACAFPAMRGRDDIPEIPPPHLLYQARRPSYKRIPLKMTARDYMKALAAADASFGWDEGSGSYRIGGAVWR